MRACVEEILPNGVLTHGEAAVDDQVGSGHTRRFVPHKKRYGFGDVACRAEIQPGRLGADTGVEIGVIQKRPDQGSLEEPGVDGVHMDLLVGTVDRELTGQVDDSALD